MDRIDGGVSGRARRAGAKLSLEEQLELDRALIDAERMMMQTVQTSLSLIGIGFTLTEFLSRATIGGIAASARLNARNLGWALLGLGLLLLALGLWNQLRYRRKLIRLSGGTLKQAHALGIPRLRDTPSFVVAVLLLLVCVLTSLKLLAASFF